MKSRKHIGQRRNSKVIDKPYLEKQNMLVWSQINYAKVMHETAELNRRPRINTE